ncbi:MAG: Tad domain-containing protein [Pseudomonadota bacterium]
MLGLTGGRTERSSEKSTVLFKPSLRRVFAGRLDHFVRDESGSFIIFTLMIFTVMVLIGGMAVDMMRYETVRVRVQSTLDRAVLAAADMDQSLNPETVVQDYFDKAGLTELIVDVNVDDDSDETTMTYRNVSATTKAAVDSMFMQFAGIDQMIAPAGGIAEERVTNVEISLVLDVSGSMANDSKLENLQDAAEEFVTTVIDPVTVADPNVEDLTHISIIPFATHVSAGPDLLSYFNVTDEHAYSHCIDFDPSDFNGVGFNAATLKNGGVGASQDLQRAGHFDPWNYSRGPGFPSTDSDYRPVCLSGAGRDILAFSNDTAEMIDFIDDFYASGKTSIEIGTKWGAALLDPSLRGVFNGYIHANLADDDFMDRPMDYPDTTPDLANGEEIETVAKILIVMSDGANTETYELKDEYRSGLTDLWYDNEADDWSIYDAQREANGEPFFFHTDTETWHEYPDGADGDKTDVQLTWPEVWANMSMRYMAYNTYYRLDYDAEVYYDYRLETFDSIGSSTKNTRTSAICKSARDAGIIVYSIGFETDEAGDATLLDCASDDAYFFEAASDCENMAPGEQCIAEVFRTIAGQINQLKLLN